MSTAHASICNHVRQLRAKRHPPINTLNWAHAPAYARSSRMWWS